VAVVQRRAAGMWTKVVMPSGDSQPSRPLAKVCDGIAPDYATARKIQAG